MPERLAVWADRAAFNVEKWGTQHPETLLAVIGEEVGELADAYLEATYEDGDRERVAEEVDDLGPLLLQLLASLERHPGAFEPLPTAEEADRGA